MEVTIEKKWVWFWQVWKIRRIQREWGYGNFLARHYRRFTKNELVESKIKMIAIRPFYWRRTLAHEMGHHKVTLKARSPQECVALNKHYDEVTNHGMTQWEWKEK